MKNYYRIRTDVAKDQVVKSKLTQDVDFLEILSLKIRQEDTYKLHVSNYGVIVGRVLANDAFGIPNARVSVFIPLEDEDELNSEIRNLYPYVDIQTKDKDNRRYNLLPDESNDICYRVVGSFPNKRLVLDNQTEIEVFDKYWKYTTVTNKSGDYMIFGVPTGSQQVHVDVDLSDIGVLSQKPRDFMYKGYSITQFDNSSQFKESTNLDNLSQLLSQTSSVYVYPFWGDTDVEEIAITRCDLQVQYKFEPTCVFFGCIVSDNFSNNIGDKCNPSKFVGFNRNLVAGEGTIEMIRKTQDGLVEEYQIQGNRLIDGNGVWCYQIPMNLDYVGTDEFGNIVPTDDPNKGIPTRTSVRFRVSMQETSSEGVSRHRAKYLIPNVHMPIKGNDGVTIADPNKYLQCYEFGSATPDEFFRDLYWNKVYSVKNYIPRVQLGSSANTQKYSAIRTVNVSNSLNPFPFNHARFRLFFAYRVLCILMTVVIAIICGLNAFVSKIAGIKILGVRPFSWICSILACIGITGGINEDESTNVEYFPCCSYSKCMKCEEAGCTKNNSRSQLMNTVQQSLAQEYDTVNLDFYNDWINGCLYLPLWFWKKTKKKKFLFGLFSKKAVNRYCNCDSNYSKLRVTENCSLHTDNNYIVNDSDRGDKYHYQYPDKPAMLPHGIIKEVENNAGLKIYYYAPGVPTSNDYKDTTDIEVGYVRLYSTDIILLGSLNECDLDNLPRPFISLPSTTANLPYIATLRSENADSGYDQDGTEEDTGIIEVTGMDWLGDNVNNGLFMDLTCTKVNTKPKTCINLARMSELGVTLDARYYDAISSNGVLKYDNERPADGLITRYELVDNEIRAMFASLNHNGLTEKVKNLNTGYYTYKLIYNYPTDFDGHLTNFAPSYTSSMPVKTYDNQDQAYVDYKFGVVDTTYKRHFYSDASGGKQMPLFNNSFYFYFGLNEGNTAIDKFNNMFYSECFKNYKYPFIMTFSSTPAKWCKEYDNVTNPLELSKIDGVSGLTTDYATITVNLKSIKLPYEYTLYNEYNTEIISETDMYTTELKFGYRIESGNYTDEKYGVVCRFTDGEPATYVSGESKTEYVYLLDNETYYLEIKDFNGNTIKQPITIIQSQITLNLNAVGLGNKYYDGITTMEEICCNAPYYGEINVESVNIDGKTLYIRSVDEYENGFKITASDSNGENDNEALIEITPMFTVGANNEVITFEKCLCSCNGSENPYIDVNDGVLKFNVWIPGDYKVTVTQFCRGVLNDNTTSETITVSNGKPFLTYIKDIPLRFILGQNSSINNPNFYSSTEVATSPYNTSVKGWFGLQNEEYYVFEKVNSESALEVWGDFINTGTTQNEDGITDLTLDTKINVLEFKFKCLMSMSDFYYAIDSTDRQIPYFSSGGKSPILYRGCYPKYSDLTQDNNVSDNKVSYVVYDSDASTTCLANSSNIVGFNYTVYCPYRNAWFRTISNGMKFNDLFEDDEHLGNYFAAFTSNAGYVYNAERGVWERTNTVYEANPFKAEHNCDNVNPGDSDSGIAFTDFPFVYENIINGNNYPYFRSLTVDRRLDYAFFILMGYNGGDIENIGISDNSSWMNTRLSGYIYNGVEMAYDNSKNIIGVMSGNTMGNDFEYYFPELYLDETSGNTCFDPNGEKLLVRYNSDVSKKKLYSCTVKSNKTFNISDRLWANGRIIDTSELNGVKFFDHSDLMSDVNGDFSQSNYPTIRKVDMYDIPSSNRFMFSASSCKFTNDLEVIDNGSEKYDFSCEVEESDTTEFTIGGNNGISFVNDSLEECAANSVGNVTFTYSSNTIFRCTEVNVRFKAKEDTANSSHSMFTYLPYYNEFTVENNPYNKLTESRMNGGVSGLANYICDTVMKGNQLNKNDIESTNSDIFNAIDVSDRAIPNDVFNFNKRRWVSKYDGIDFEMWPFLYDDETNYKSITYRLNKGISITTDVVSIYYFRRYINAEGDNLSKDILTFNIGAIIDVRQFAMTCECSIDKSMSGSDTVDIDVPTYEEDEDGNPITGSTTESDEVNIEIERQVTEFFITIPTSAQTSFNQQFTKYDKMSAAIKYDGKVDSNATLSLVEKDGNKYLSVKMIWSGALSGVLLDIFPKATELYLKMPSGLIFKIKFNLNSAGLIT